MICLLTNLCLCLCLCVGGRVLVQAPDPPGPAQGGDGAAELHRREVRAAPPASDATLTLTLTLTLCVCVRQGRDGGVQGARHEALRQPHGRRAAQHRVLALHLQARRVALTYPNRTEPGQEHSWGMPCQVRSGQVGLGHALIEDGGRSGALYSVSSNSYNELISISLPFPLPSPSTTLT